MAADIRNITRTTATDAAAVASAQASQSYPLSFEVPPYTVHHTTLDHCTAGLSITVHPGCRLHRYLLTKYDLTVGTKVTSHLLRFVQSV